MLLTLLDPEKNTPLQQWSFENESIVRIGRSPENHVVIPNALVSRDHVELQRVKSGANRQWYLVNSGTNGTFVNGTLMSQGWISDGALIQLARDGPILHFQVLTIQVGGKIEAIPTLNPGTPRCTHAGNPPGNLFCIHCGEPIKVDRTIRHYQVLRTLGQGGMGTTTLAWDRQKAKAQQPGSSPAASLVVLKEMNADMAQIVKAQELFEREAKTLLSLIHI
jgi:serine/threonine-protein kinase